VVQAFQPAIIDIHGMQAGKPAPQNACTNVLALRAELPGICFITPAEVLR
jgi:hypothetical protein